MVADGVGTASGAMATARETAVEVVDVFLDYILPIALFFAGFVIAQTLGLSGFYAAFVSQAPINANLQNLLAEILAAVTWGALGGGLVAIGHKHDHWVGAVVAAIGWLFVGAAIAEAANLVLGGAPYAGALDGASLLSQVQSGFQGGGGSH